jgi:hypothetical protein
MSSAMSGLELARRFYFETVLSIVEATFPGLAHSAARIGRGSEVLGFDDRVSAEHISPEPRQLRPSRSGRYGHGSGIRTPGGSAHDHQP